MSKQLLYFLIYYPFIVRFVKRTRDQKECNSNSIGNGIGISKSRSRSLVSESEKLMMNSKRANIWYYDINGARKRWNGCVDIPENIVQLDLSRKELIPKQLIGKKISQTSKDSKDSRDSIDSIYRYRYSRGSIGKCDISSVFTWDVPMSTFITRNEEYPQDIEWLSNLFEYSPSLTFSHITQLNLSNNGLLENDIIKLFSSISNRKERLFPIRQLWLDNNCLFTILDLEKSVQCMNIILNTIDKHCDNLEYISMKACHLRDINCNIITNYLMNCIKNNANNINTNNLNSNCNCNCIPFDSKLLKINLIDNVDITIEGINQLNRICKIPQILESLFDNCNVIYDNKTKSNIDKNINIINISCNPMNLMDWCIGVSTPLNAVDRKYGSRVLEHENYNLIMDHFDGLWNTNIIKLHTITEKKTIADLHLNTLGDALPCNCYCCKIDAQCYFPMYR